MSEKDIADLFTVSNLRAERFSGAKGITMQEDVLLNKIPLSPCVPGGLQFKTLFFRNTLRTRSLRIRLIQKKSILLQIFRQADSRSDEP